MSDKRIIIIAVILALILIGAGWYFSEKKPNENPASISNSATTSSQGTPGIVLGIDDASVVIEEYTNFLCSHCANFALQTLPMIVQDYIPKVKVKMIIYILPPYELARASYCANQAGKFNQFQDYMFNHQADIKGEQDVLDAAKTLELGDNFEQCYNSDAAKTAGQDWYNKAGEKGVEGTPTFFINGEEVVGAVPYEDFQKAIDSKLQ